MKSASYTRGVQPLIMKPSIVSMHSSFSTADAGTTTTATHHHHQAQRGREHGQQHRYQMDSTTAMAEDPSVAPGSILLGHYKRHSASMTAAPICGTQFDHTMSRTTSATSHSPPSQHHTEYYHSPKIPVQDACCGYSQKTTSSSLGGLAKRWSQILLDSSWLNQKRFRNNKVECAAWFFLACLIIAGYYFLSDGSFSAVLTLASAFQCFSLVLLNLKVYSQKTASGISQRSVLLIALGLVFRLASTLFYYGYLPVDRSGDWVYQMADIITVILTGTLLFYSHHYCLPSIQVQYDKDSCAIAIPLAVVAVLALCVHPTLNQNMIADVSWTFALYVETFSMVPQLFMMGKLGGEVEALTSHYIASMAVSKVLVFVFWYFSFTELAPRGGGWNIAGWAVMLSYSIQTLLFADFM